MYLDFDGHVTQNTLWNSSYFNKSSIQSPAYSTDGDLASFSAAELADIQQAWQRVAEDYLPFEVNVTTVDPGIEALRRSGGGDIQWGVRIVITADTEGTGAGGIAYVDSFNWSSDTPAFVYTTGGKYIAEAASHEIGHTLGLAHDGNGSTSYYEGHGSGATGWAPIMGVGYYREVTQWDRGEYTGANNGGANANYGKGPDDIAIISSYNGFGYRADDYSDSLASATALLASAGSIDGAGIIGTAQDVDFFSFVTGAGQVAVNVTPAALGANLDVRLQLLDAAGNVLASDNAADRLAAGLNLDLPAGTYFLKIEGVGVGNPAASPPTGYSDYGSIGQYTIGGTIVDAGQSPTFVVTDATVQEADGIAIFTVSVNGPILGEVSVEYVTVADSATADSDYTSTSGTLRFVEGGPTSQQVSVPLNDDQTSEPSERFFLRLQNAVNAQIVDSLGVGTIIDDDISLSIGNAIMNEGSPSQGKKATTKLTPMTFTVSLSAPATDSVTVSYATSDMTATSGSDYQSLTGSITFQPGETAKTISVLIIGDSTIELDEKLAIVLSAASGASIADDTGEGTIADDDRRGKPRGILSAIRKTVAPVPRPVRDVFVRSATGLDHDHDRHADDYDAHGALDAIPQLSLRLPLSNRGFQAAPAPAARPSAAFGAARRGASLDLVHAARQRHRAPREVVPLRASEAARDSIALGQAAGDDAAWLDLLAADTASARLPRLVS